MTRTLVLAGKIGPAFASTSDFDGAAHVTIAPVLASPMGIYGYSREYFNGMKPGAVLQNVLECVGEDFGAFLGNTLLDPAQFNILTPQVVVPSFTMCECPEGRECHNCK